ncbi:hypothetical protein E2C01_048387 [Portunus trituberculatus]|uniref:Uncharacterized protein n=1 Tax=Portunus trituberculatus TaxID=210409 RepID=A0A5B7GA34_PORTR|nr:hypothetical protein [Portunus trituberculatus]
MWGGLGVGRQACPAAPAVVASSSRGHECFCLPDQRPAGRLSSRCCPTPPHAAPPLPQRRGGAVTGSHKVPTYPRRSSYDRGCNSCARVISWPNSPPRRALLPAGPLLWWWWRVAEGSGDESCGATPTRATPAADHCHKRVSCNACLAADPPLLLSCLSTWQILLQRRRGRGQSPQSTAGASTKATVRSSTRHEARQREGGARRDCVVDMNIHERDYESSTSTTGIEKGRHLWPTYITHFHSHSSPLLDVKLKGKALRPDKSRRQDIGDTTITSCSSSSSYSCSFVTPNKRLLQSLRYLLVAVELRCRCSPATPAQTTGQEQTVTAGVTSLGLARDKAAVAPSLHPVSSSSSSSSFSSDLSASVTSGQHVILTHAMPVRSSGLTSGDAITWCGLRAACGWAGRCRGADYPV